MNKTFLLYEAKDASINISVGFDLGRWLAGIAFTVAPFNRDVMMAMAAIHLGPMCFTFTNFRIRADRPEPALPQQRRSPTRKSGGYKRR